MAKLETEKLCLITKQNGASFDNWWTELRTLMQTTPLADEHLRSRFKWSQNDH